MRMLPDGASFRATPPPKSLGAATAPTYGPYDTFVGQGVVGSYTDTFQSTGEALGRLALDILGGKEEAQGDLRNPQHAFRVDARELKRWGLPRENLPPNTVVLFDEKTVWKDPANFIIAALAVIAIQSALLVALLIQPCSPSKG